MESKLQGGLLPLPKDARDFETGRVFGGFLPLPTEDFGFLILGMIKNQAGSDYCTGYGVTLASENQEKTELNPEFQFAATKYLSGDPDSWGADIRTACKSAVKFGSLPQHLAKYGPDSPREAVTDFSVYNPYLREMSEHHKKHSFFAVTGPYDTFDNIRASMNQHQQPVVTGSLWRPEWNTPDGIIPKEYQPSGFGHCYVFVGQRTINGEIYLIAQNSAGTGYGAGGKHYFPREVVNKECTFGNYVFVDLPKEEAKVLNDWKLSLNWRWFARILIRVRNIFKSK